MAICCCDSRRDAMRRGEMAQDRWGRWRFPIDQIAAAFRQPSVSSRFHWTHCPFCNEPLPNVNDGDVPWKDPGFPPPADSVGDGEGQADGN